MRVRLRQHSIINYAIGLRKAISLQYTFRLCVVAIKVPIKKSCGGLLQTESEIWADWADWVV